MLLPEVWGRIYALIHLIDSVQPDDMRKFAEAPWVYFPSLYQDRLPQILERPAVDAALGDLLATFDLPGKGEQALSFSVAEQLAFYHYLFTALQTPPYMGRKSGKRRSE